MKSVKYSKVMLPAAIALVITVSMIVIGFFAKETNRSLASVSDEEIAELRRQCRSLPVPSFFRKDNEAELMKLHSALIEQRFLSEAAPADVEQFFVEEMPKSGWSIVERRDDVSIKLVFFKAGTNVILEYNSFSIVDTRNYFVNCSIRKN